MGKLVTFLAFFLASVIPDALGKLLGMMLTNPHLDYALRDKLAALSNWPWTSLVFGVSFALVASVVSERHNSVSKDEIIAFVLICPLIAIILMYGGNFVRPILATANIPAEIFFSALQALLIALVAYHGLSIPLGSLGVLLISLLGALLALVVLRVPKLPINLFEYWYSIVGTAIGFFAARDRVSQETSIRR